MDPRTRIALVMLVIALAGAAHGAIVSRLSAQEGARPPLPTEDQTPIPPLLFREPWQQSPSAIGVPTSRYRVNVQYWLASQSAVTNPNLEAKFYGADAKNITVYQHQSRYDLWTGLANSAVAVTLRDRNNLLDLSGLARVRAILRTSGLHQLHAIVRFADGTLAAGSRPYTTDSQFVMTEVAFSNQRWQTVDPETLAVVRNTVTQPDLARVDEVGFVDFAVGGGPGGGWSNISTVEVYAKAVPRR